MRIGIDIDGVLANWSGAAREMLNERFDVGLDPRGEVPTWDFIKDRVTAKQWAWLWTAGVDRGLFMRPNVLLGSVYAMARLCASHDVILLTDRPRDARHHTLKWIAQNFPFDIAGVLINKTKTEIRCDIFLDDKPSNVVEIQKAFPKALVCLMNCKYNQSFEWPKRINSWEAFLSFVAEVEGDEGS